MANKYGIAYPGQAPTKPTAPTNNQYSDYQLMWGQNTPDDPFKRSLLSAGDNDSAAQQAIHGYLRNQLLSDTAAYRPAGQQLHDRYKALVMQKYGYTPDAMPAIQEQYNMSKRYAGSPMHDSIIQKYDSLFRELGQAKSADAYGRDVAEAYADGRNLMFDFQGSRIDMGQINPSNPFSNRVASQLNDFRNIRNQFKTNKQRLAEQYAGANKNYQDALRDYEGAMSAYNRNVDKFDADIDQAEIKAKRQSARYGRPYNEQATKDRIQAIVARKSQKFMKDQSPLAAQLSAAQEMREKEKERKLRSQGRYTGA